MGGFWLCLLGLVVLGIMYQQAPQPRPLPQDLALGSPSLPLEKSLGGAPASLSPHFLSSQPCLFILGFRSLWSSMVLHPQDSYPVW